MPETRLVAVAGCGSIGARYVRWLRALGNTVVAFDVDTGRRQLALSEGARTVYGTAAGLLESGASHLVVATPPEHHAALAAAALEQGVSVLIEKPVVCEPAAAGVLLAAAASSTAPAWVVCNMRFHEGIAAVRAHLQAIGRPLFARAHFGHRLSQMRPAGLGAYAAARASGGGVLLDCIHEFDYLRWLLGPIRSVRGVVATLGDEVGAGEDYADVQLVLGDGVRASLHLDFLMRRKRRGLEIHGEEGSLLWHSEGRQPEECLVSFGNRDGARVVHRNPDVRAEDAYLRMLDAFLAGGEGLQTLDEGMAALRAALAVGVAA